MTRSGSAAATGKKWPLMECLSFLEPHIHPRRSLSCGLHCLERFIPAYQVIHMLAQFAENSQWDAGTQLLSCLILQDRLGIKQ